MRALVTGATGKVGNAIARSLTEQGTEVRAMVRSPDRAASILPADIQVVPGDVTEPSTLAAAVSGCQLVFNALGIPEQWLVDPERFHAVNAAGTGTLAQAAAAGGVTRLVHISTIDVFDLDHDGRLSEDRLASSPARTPYQASKREAEQQALAVAKDLEVVIVNPAAVYGLGPLRPHSLEADLLAPLIRRRLPAIPPGAMSVVFTESLASGAILAAQRGRAGERYILADQHVTVREFCRLAVQHLGRRHLPPTLPVAVARVLAAASEAIARFTRVPPMLASGQLDFFLSGARADASKAREQLDWTPSSLVQGVGETVDALRNLEALAGRSGRRPAHAVSGYSQVRG
jgi:dihydroflavonol-4-reductase